MDVEAVRKAFALFDKDGSGTLEASEVAAILTNTGGGRPLSAEEAQGVINELDANGDGVLDVEEMITKIKRGGVIMSGDANTQDELDRLQGELTACQTGLPGSPVE